MANNLIMRSVDISHLGNIPLSDYSEMELVKHLITTYPNDPHGALGLLRDNFEIGSILYQKASLILEGMNYVKR